MLLDSIGKSNLYTLLTSALYFISRFPETFFFWQIQNLVFNGEAIQEAAL